MNFNYKVNANLFNMYTYMKLVNLYLISITLSSCSEYIIFMKRSLRIIIISFFEHHSENTEMYYDMFHVIAKLETTFHKDT